MADGVCAAALVLVAAAPTLPVAFAASVLVGVSTVTASVVGPMAARLTPNASKGRVSGVLLTGSIVGMLLARTVAGATADHLGWRLAYLGAAVSTLVLGAVSARFAPSARPALGSRYRELLTDPLRLLAAEPELRRSSLYQATVFAGFTAIWSTVALLITSAPYSGTATTVGLLALVNTVTMFAVPIAGRWTDRYGSDQVNWVGMSTVAAAALLLPIAVLGGPAGWITLVLGTLLLDVGMQTGMVANQVRIYTLRSDATSRMNTAYMTCAYLGGSLGSLMAGALFARLGWAGPCLELAGLIMIALGMHLHHARMNRHGFHAASL